LNSVISGGFITLLLSNASFAFVVGFVFMFSITLFRFTLRSQWLASAAFVVLWTLYNAALSGWSPATLTYLFLSCIFWAVLITKYGLLVGFSTWFVYAILASSPITSHFSAWYASPGKWTLLIVAAMAIYAFCTSSLVARPACNPARAAVAS
jgi:hypothetical protein